MISRTGSCSLHANANLTVARSVAVNTTRPSVIRGPVTSSSLTSGALSVSAAMTAGGDVTTTGTVTSGAIKHSHFWHAKSSSHPANPTPIINFNTPLVIEYDLVLRSSPGITANAAGSEWTFSVAGLYLVTASVRLTAIRTPTQGNPSTYKPTAVDDGLVIIIVEIVGPTSYWHYANKIMGRNGRTTGLISASAGTKIGIYVYQQYKSGCFIFQNQNCVAYDYEQQIDYTGANSGGNHPSDSIMEMSIDLITQY